MSLWVLLIIVLIPAAGAVWLYNGLVRLRNMGENAWSDIDVQLKRRHDLVPNLVETVKGYAQHEQKTFSDVVAARGRAQEAAGPVETGRAEGDLTRVLGRLFAVAEAYPQLRASENFLGLQRDLGVVEDAIQNARRYYNAVVRDLNTACETFPSNLVAGAFGFGKRDYFELDADAERSAPVVSIAS